MSNMSIRLASAVFAAAATVAVSSAVAPHVYATKSEKVTICHATNSQTNPYVGITVNSSSINEKNNAGYNGHGNHNGGVWHQGVAAHSWGDIIPAFESPKGTSFPGSNWSTAGQAIYNNGCQPVVVVTASSTTMPKPHPKPIAHPVSARTTPVKTAVSHAVEHSSAPASKSTVNTPQSSVSELPHTGISALVTLVTGLGLGAVTYILVYALRRH